MQTMTIYIIETDFQDHKTGSTVFTKTAGICYKALEQAIEYVRTQADYKGSINSFLHYGVNHRWTIRSVTLL